MYPRLPGIGLPTYGLLVATGFVLALLLVGRLAAQRGLGRHVVQDIVVRGSLWGLLGAKLTMIVLDPASFREQPWSVLFQGGVFYGGLVAAVIAGFWCARRRGLDVHAVADVVAAPLALGHAFGRTGCFLAGCCWGTPCEAPWGVTFTDPRAIVVESGWPTMALHPVQLYEAAGNLVLVALALLVLSRSRIAGQTWWAYVAAYGAFRLVIEHWRGNPRGAWLDGRVSTSQVVGAFAIVLGVTMVVVLTARARRGDRRTPPAGDLPAVAGAAAPQP